MEAAAADHFTHRDLFRGKHLFSLIEALVLLGAAYVVEHFANLYELEYSARPTSVYVGDILLDNLPVIDLNFVIIEVALLSIVVGTIFVLSKPRYALFSLKALALFIMARALFISLTHVGIYPGTIHPGVGIFDGLYTYLNWQTGFFFSGHTGLPFLIALIFWDHRRVRYALIALSATFAVAVLLAHVHYSIDVLAAPFMTYGIYRIAKFLFRKDFELITPVPLLSAGTVPRTVPST